MRDQDGNKINVHLMENQEKYCRDCVNRDSCNVFLQDGEYCIEKEIE